MNPQIRPLCVVDDDGSDEEDEDEDGLSYAEYEEILCGVRRWIEAAREKAEDEEEEEEEGKTVIVGELSPTEGLSDELKDDDDEEEEDLRRDRSAAAAARSLSSQLSRDGAMRNGNF